MRLDRMWRRTIRDTLLQCTPVLSRTIHAVSCPNVNPKCTAVINYPNVDPEYAAVISRPNQFVTYPNVDPECAAVVVSCTNQSVACPNVESYRTTDATRPNVC